MGDKTRISWSDASWPITSGCAIVSSGCKNCFALRLSATRLRHVPAYEGVATMQGKHPVWTGKINLLEDRLDWPLRWQRPRRIFVADMSDLFHPGVPDAFLDRVFDVIEQCPRHTFQVLTKRPERMLWYMLKRYGPAVTDDPAHPWTEAEPPANLWVGTSVEDQRRADERIPFLLETPAVVRFLSCEPLLSSIDLSRWLGDCSECGGTGMSGGLFCFSCQGTGFKEDVPPGELHWVIVGGESGPRRREMKPEWAAQIRDQCATAGVAFWFKQMSGQRSETHPYLEGFKYAQWPGKPVSEQPPTPWGSCPGEDVAEAFAGETACV